MVHWNKTKIVATIGPASNKRKELKSLIHAGVDVFRLNGAHGTISEHVDTIRLIRAVAEREKFPAAILLDLPGPKIRVGTLKEEPIYLKAGTNITLRCGQQVQKGNEIPVQMKEVARGVHPGSQIFMNDGIIELKGLRVQGFDVECRVRSAGELRSNKGLNLPNAKLGLPSLMPKDEKLVQMAVKEKVD